MHTLQRFHTLLKLEIVRRQLGLVARLAYPLADHLLCPRCEGGERCAVRLSTPDGDSYAWSTYEKFFPKASSLSIFAVVV